MLARSSCRVRCHNSYLVFGLSILRHDITSEHPNSLILPSNKPPTYSIGVALIAAFLLSLLGHSYPVSLATRRRHWLRHDLRLSRLLLVPDYHCQALIDLVKKSFKLKALIVELLALGAGTLNGREQDTGWSILRVSF